MDGALPIAISCVPRPDVNRVHPGHVGSASFGFELSVRWRDLPGGMCRPKLRAAYRALEAEVDVGHVAVPPILCGIDEATARISTAGNSLRVRGWAASLDRSAIGMTVTDGQRSVPLDVYWYLRPDIPPHLGDTEEAPYGFSARGDIAGLAVDLLQLRLQCATGHQLQALPQLRRLQDTVLFHVNQSDWIEGGKQLAVSGWAAGLTQDIEWVGLLHRSVVVARAPATIPVTQGPLPPSLVPTAHYCGFALTAQFGDSGNRPIDPVFLVASIGDEIRRVTLLKAPLREPADPAGSDEIRACWDEPANGATIAEDQSLRLVGWAFSRQGEKLAVEAYDGERLIAQTAPSLPRPDVARTHAIAQDTIRPGFALQTNIRLQPYQATEIRLRCRSANGNAFDLGTRRFVGTEAGLFTGSRWAKWQTTNAPSRLSRADAAAAMAGWHYYPTLSILMPQYNPNPALLDRAVQSVTAQWYEKFELCVADDGSADSACIEYLKALAARYPWVRTRRLRRNGGIAAATNAAAELATGEYILLLDQDDELSPNCLFEFVKYLNEDSEADILYSDSDKIDTQGRRYDPSFKPDYNPALLYSYMYMNHALLVRRQLFKSVGGFRLGFDGSQDHDLALRLVEQTTRIVHIPAILYHWRAHAGSTALSGSEKPGSFAAAAKAIGDSLRRRGLPFKTVKRPQFAVGAGIGCHRVHWKIMAKPLVSIVIPSRDHALLLAQCIDSIERHTTYRHYEIIVVDDNSDDPATLAYLAEIEHLVVRDKRERRGFNFSALVNTGVRAAKGDYLVILNNDIEVLTTNWLEELLGWAQQPDVGVVGCRLLYPGGEVVQHAGVSLRLSENDLPGHLFRGEPAHSGGYCSWARVARDSIAVTFAAAMIPRRVFDRLGGLDEDAFPAAYQDPDFSLRAAQQGYRTVYTPFAELIHHESASKPHDFADVADQLRFRLHWPLADRYLNPNLQGVGERPAVVGRRVLLTNPRAGVRMAVLAHNTKRQGAPISNLLMLRGLAERHGFELHLITVGDGPLLAEYKTCARSVTELSGSDALPLPAQARAALDEIAPDLVYGYTLDACWFIETALDSGYATYWNIHESADPTIFFADREGVQRQAQRCLAETSRLGFVARSTRDLFRSNFEELAPTVVIHNGVDLHRFQPLPSGASRPWAPDGTPGAIVLGTVGTVCPRKALHLAIRAFIRLQREHPLLPLWFVSVGEMPVELSGYLDLVCNVIKQSPHPERILLLPEADDILDWYRSLDVFVLSSLEESFPRVVIEAMACGLPIVAASTFGVAEQVIDGHTGRVVKPGDVDGMAAALEELLDDATVRREMGRQGRRLAESAFSIDSTVDRYAREFRLLREERG